MTARQRTVNGAAEQRSGLALELASTIRHDGSGGVADELETAEALAGWVRKHVIVQVDVIGQPDVSEQADVMSHAYDDAVLQRVLAVRRAVRSLFARAVRPEPPSPADADRLLADPDAVTVLNDAAALAATSPRLAWPDGGAPTVHRVPAGGLAPGDRLVALLAQAAIDFLTGPSRERLRACAAPRCVRYFVKEHGRQEWCKASCGNRARAARHYRRHRQEAAPDEGGAGPSIAE